MPTCIQSKGSSWLFKPFQEFQFARSLLWVTIPCSDPSIPPPRTSPGIFRSSWAVGRAASTAQGSECTSSLGSGLK